MIVEIYFWIIKILITLEIAIGVKLTIAMHQ